MPTTPGTATSPPSTGTPAFTLSSNTSRHENPSTSHQVNTQVKQLSNSQETKAKVNHVKLSHTSSSPAGGSRSAVNIVPLTPPGTATLVSSASRAIGVTTTSYLPTSSGQNNPIAIVKNQIENLGLMVTRLPNETGQFIFQPSSYFASSGNKSNSNNTMGMMVTRIPNKDSRQFMSPPPVKSKSPETASPLLPTEDPKLVKFKKLIFEDEVADMNQLRSLSWAGIPFEVRPITWKLLLGYLPVMKSRRSQVAEAKRVHYDQLVSRYYNDIPTGTDETWRQIHIDIPRMQPLISIFQQEVVQKMFERILYIWSIRHPASGYVQGMNDLATPFFVTYLSEFVSIPGNSSLTLKDVENFDVSSLSPEVLRAVEADSFWSFSKLLDSIQDNYTFAQPGIQRLVNLLSRVMSRVDANLHQHLMNNSVQYLQFAFRWMNNLLIRELPLRCIIRLWDTYLSEGAVSTTTSVMTTSANSSNGAVTQEAAVEEGDASSSENNLTSQTTIPYDPNPWSLVNGTPFSCSFHLFVCAAFLRFWSKSLMREQDFQGLILLLQNLPTFHWTESEIKLMVADAYQLKYIFTPNHLNS